MLQDPGEKQSFERSLGQTHLLTPEGLTLGSRMVADIFHSITRSLAGATLASP